MGHEVYDFRDGGFARSDIDHAWLDWNPAKFIDALEHEDADGGFARDFAAMKWADVFLLLMPCGSGAHLEGGWDIGQGKLVAIFLSEYQFEPELIFKMADKLIKAIDRLMTWLEFEEVKNPA